MTKDQLKFGFIGLLLGGVVVGAFLLLTQTKPSVTQNPPIKQESPDTLDAHFIEQMIPHHEDAITMSELALEKATRPEVKELAQSIIESQSEEISQMKSWYKDWVGKDVPSDSQVMGMHGMQQRQKMHMGMMGDETDITKLESAEDFDKEFIRQMIPHHQMAVMMGNMLRNGTQREEMRGLADDIISAQNGEINLMRGWLNEWTN